jgi:hypothetical protein
MLRFFSMHLFLVRLLLGPNTSWLVGTDAVLGLFTLLLLAVVVVAILGGLIGRLRKPKSDLIQGTDASTLTQLGVAITDEEERPDERDLHPGRIPTTKAKGATFTG